MVLRVLVIKPGAVPPQRQTFYNAGVSLHALEPVSVGPKTYAKIATGIALIMPMGCYGRIAPLLPDTDVTSHILNSNDTSEVCVHIANMGETPLTIGAGDAIASLIVTPYMATSTNVVSKNEFDYYAQTRQNFREDGDSYTNPI